MTISSYYDEEGRYHVHDGNWVTSAYACDQGHYFSEKVKQGCELCGIETQRELNWSLS